MWALSSSTPEADVMIHELLFMPRKPPRPVPLSELAITMSLYRDWPPYTSRPKRRGYCLESAARQSLQVFRIDTQAAINENGNGIWYSTDSDFIQRQKLRAAVDRAA